MTFLESFVRHFVKRAEPSLEQSPAGDRWRIRIPVPVFVVVELSQREVVGGRLNYSGFLREVASRIDVAVAAGVQQFEDGAKVPELQKRLETLEWERAE